MSTIKPDGTSEMAILENELLDSILELSEADLDAELRELGLDPSHQEALARAAVAKGFKAAGKTALAAAKSDLERFKSQQVDRQRDATSGRALLERIKAKDPEMSGMMMAARKGTTLSESDEEGIAEDLVDLEDLSKEPD